MQQTSDNDERRHPWRYRLLVPLGIILLGLTVALILTWTAPEPEQRERQQQPRLVEVTTVSRGDEPALIRAWGEVIPAREVALQPRVSGTVLDTTEALEPGARAREGELLLRIDPADFALAVEQRRAELERARAQLQLERGNQVVAQQEFELLGESVSGEERALMLRRPQLDSARASVSAAEAALDQARLNLDRSRLKAPFDAVVLSREVTRGAQVSSNTTVARLAGTDEYWVELSVPVSQLQWIRLPRDGGEPSEVTLFHDGVWEGASRSGTVLRLKGDLETRGRMARLLVRVPDPLALESGDPDVPPLLLGSFLRADITGRTLEGVVALERAWLRDNDRVWVMNDEHRLEIREVDVVLRSAGTVYVRDGLADGERVVTSSITVPADGMRLRLRDSNGENGS